MTRTILGCIGFLVLGFHTTASAALPTCGPTAIDPDNDGWGWEDPGPGSCKMPDGGSGNNNTGACPTGNGDKNRITHVILTAGQSNAVARTTHYKNDEQEADRCSNNVFVWHNGQWTLANLNNQQWLSQMIVPQSHGGFQIAKQIHERDSSHVIGIVPTGTNGKPISYWVNGPNSFTGNFTSVINKTRDAVNNLSQLSKVSLIWWMQGEADNGNNNYGQDLEYLIKGFSDQPWFDKNQKFVANKTLKSSNTNAFIGALDSDADTDALTCSSPGEKSAGFDPVGYVVYDNGASNNDQSHFSSSAYRKIGSEVAQRFLGTIACGASEPPTGGECVDYLPHDGWGWDGVRSCQPIDRKSQW